MTPRRRAPPPGLPSPGVTSRPGADPITVTLTRVTVTGTVGRQLGGRRARPGRQRAVYDKPDNLNYAY
jgi:hypothetical protein